MLFFQVSLILQFQQLAHLCHLCLQATRLTTSWEDDGRFFSSKQDMFAHSQLVENQYFPSWQLWIQNISKLSNIKNSNKPFHFQSMTINLVESRWLLLLNVLIERCLRYI